MKLLDEAAVIARGEELKRLLTAYQNAVLDFAVARRGSDADEAMAIVRSRCDDLVAFALPATPLPSVTDEMVERAFEAYHRSWPRKLDETSDEHLRRFLRAIIDAALAPKPAPSLTPRLGRGSHDPR